MPTPHNIVFLFEPFRGDLLYGFREDRADCITHLRSFVIPQSELKRFFVEQHDIAWITIDSWNDICFGSATQQALFNASDDAQAATNSAAMGTEAATVAGNNQRTAEFWQNLRQSRYSPLEVFNSSQSKIDQEGWRDLAQDRYYLAIRRACKFGIQQTLDAAAQNAQIHFLLDRFAANQGERMRGAATKQSVDAGGRTALPITYSEIRHIYRHWDELKDKIIFYYDFVAAEHAPWEDDTRSATWTNNLGHQLTMTYRELWALYGEARRDKYKALYNKAALDPRYARQLATHLNQLMRIVSDADVQEGAGNVAQAQESYELALAILEPDKNKWKGI